MPQPHAEEARRRDLEQRPTADSRSVEDLLVDLQQGKIRIPEFQRGLRWEDEDRVKLLDSILRGFPIGTLLFWKKEAEAGPVHIGPLEIQARSRSDALWVVDGQQRLITLAVALLHKPAEDDENARFMVVDLQTFVVDYRRRNDLAERHLPLFQAGDTERLLEWVHRRELPEELRRAAFAVSKRVREYQIPLYVVESLDEQVLRSIFDRTNTSGKPLTKSEVFDALHGGQTEGHPSSLEEIAREIEAIGFGSVDPKIVLRALLAVQGKDPSHGFRQIDDADVPGALQETARALELAVRFVRDEAGFPHISLLPYKLPLATLTLFFHRHPESSPRTRTLLRRWIWRGAINGSHSGDTVGLRSTLQAIDAVDEEGSVQTLLAMVAEPLEELDLQPFRFSYARSKLQLVGLADLRPRHLETGAKLDVAGLCDEDRGPAPPIYSKPRRRGAERGLAGRLLHPWRPPGELRTLLASAGIEVLASHGVPQEAAAALAAGNADDFFERRERHLDQTINEYLRAQAEWGATDRPSLQYLRSA